MSGFTNQDGSALVGGLTPLGAGQALQLDTSGNLKVTGGGGGGSSDVAIHDNGTPAQHLAIDATGKVGINNFPSEQAVNLNQVNGSALSTSNPVPTDMIDRIARLLGVAKLVDAGGSNLLAIDASGRLMLVPNQSVNVAQMGGVNTQMLTADSVAGGNVMEMGLGAYNGSTVDRILADLKALRVSLFGKNAANADTAIAVDASGNLRVVDMIAGNPAGLTNPYPSADQIRLWLQNGQNFNGTTGKQTSAAGAQVGFSIFNPAANTKNILIYSFKLFVNANATALLQATTSDPALGTAASLANLKGGGASSTLSTVSFANTAVATAGSALDAVSLPGNNTIELLTNGAALLLPQGSANGVALYPNLAGVQTWAVTAKWIEY